MYSVYHWECLNLLLHCWYRFVWVLNFQRRNRNQIKRQKWTKKKMKNKIESMCRLCVSVCVVFAFLRYLRFLVGNLPKASTRTSNSTNNINWIRVAEQSERDNCKCWNWQEQEIVCYTRSIFLQIFQFSEQCFVFSSIYSHPNRKQCAILPLPVCVCVPQIWWIHFMHAANFREHTQHRMHTKEAP